MTMGSKLDATWSKANKYQYFILNKNLLTKFDFPISHSILHSLSFFQIKKNSKEIKNHPWKTLSSWQAAECDCLYQILHFGLSYI